MMVRYLNLTILFLYKFIMKDMKSLLQHINESSVNNESSIDLLYIRKQLSKNYLDFYLNKNNYLSDAIKLTKESVNKDIASIMDMGLGHIIISQVIGRMIEHHLVDNINYTNKDFEFRQGNEGTRKKNGQLKDKDLMCVRKPSHLNIETLCEGIEDVYEDVLYVSKSSINDNYIYGIELKTSSSAGNTFTGNKYASLGDNEDNVKNSFYILIKYTKDKNSNLIKKITAYFTFITHGSFIGSTSETTGFSNFKLDDACIKICEC